MYYNLEKLRELEGKSTILNAKVTLAIGQHMIFHFDEYPITTELELFSPEGSFEFQILGYSKVKLPINQKLLLHGKFQIMGEDKDSNIENSNTRFEESIPTRKYYSELVFIIETFEIDQD